MTYQNQSAKHQERFKSAYFHRFNLFPSFGKSLNWIKMQADIFYNKYFIPPFPCFSSLFVLDLDNTTKRVNHHYLQWFSTQSRGTSGTLMILCRNLNVPNTSTILRFFKRTQKEMAEPLYSAEPGWKTPSLNYLQNKSFCINRYICRIIRS